MDAEAILQSKRCFAVLGSRTDLVAAEVLFKLRRLSRARDGSASPDLFASVYPAGDVAALCARIAEMQDQHGAQVLLPSLVALAALPQPLPAGVVDPVAALLDHLGRHAPGARRIGVLTGDPVVREYLATRFDPERWTLVFPRAEVPPAEVGVLDAATVDVLAAACQELRAQGAEVVVPGCPSFSLFVDELCARGQFIVDMNLVYARYALEHAAAPRSLPRKIGVVGGVGPAATVDFTDKIVRNTCASRDQEHIKVVIEMNPQIPDRTAHLVGAGEDPSMEIFATCRQLELDAADFIAIPCNTAHAFVARVQPYLGIPVVNMLAETVAYIRRLHAQRRRVGLLGTSGTIASRVYHGFVEAAGLEIMVPDDEHQALVMRAIYGEQGVKAGFTRGPCREDLMRALEHLVARGAEVVLLGCTELPLIQAMDEDFRVGEKRIVLLDPTTILARRCVALALAGQ